MSDSSPKYLVRDPQGNVYGPADEAMLRDWVQQGRIVAGMDVAPRETREWVEVSQHPVLADLFARSAPAAPADQASLGPTVTPAPATEFAPDHPQVTPQTPLAAGSPVAPYGPASGTVTVVPHYESPVDFATAMGVQMNVPALIGLITGILSLLASLCACIAVPLALVAIILSSIGLHQINHNPQRYQGQGAAIAGLATGILAILIGAASLLFFAVRH